LSTPSRAKGVEYELVHNGSLVPIEGVDGIYRVDVPYASSIPISDEQVIQEAHPWAVFSHLTALAHHGLTDLIPEVICVSNYDHKSHRLPLGTTPEDWAELKLPGASRPHIIEHVQIRWIQTKGEWDFGISVVHSHGIPLYMTDPERTLLDALRRPEESGGIANVLRAWRRATDSVSMNTLTGYAEQLGKIMRQRTGFILERLHVEHPRFSNWQQDLVRGSSVKLLASQPFCSAFSERWNLSLNVPVEVLGELDD
jgi:predicted transcriptional regulator of viral defense system